ncbi:MAG: DNA repair protein RadA [Bacteroidetes bacterium]|nr:DNA repair protein RadA [Bacteroidota bacterium]
MSKVKTAFFCSSCGYESAKWLGKCPACNQWNTFIEEVIERSQREKNLWKDSSSKRQTAKAKLLDEVENTKEERLITSDTELNRTLGGGIVSGSIVLLAGEPGIGKSTLLLQDALHLKNILTLYISGEESEQQIKMRANRLEIQNENFYILTETSLSVIFSEIKKLQPSLVVIDSIQTLQSENIEAAPGSIAQVRECAAALQRFAKETYTPVFLIGHITKDGSIAGPKILEHIVDTVLQFEGDQHYSYRILRTLKNRFGSTSELGIYEMMGNGMRMVHNPSEILIHQKEEILSGSAIAAGMEGLRPLLIETQALVTQSVYGTPQRTVSGLDSRRLQLLLAVLEKRGGFQFGMKDVFVNIAGGLRIDDPSTDLAIICALLSSYDDAPLSPNVCFAGEVGLNGEIRAVNRVEQRIAEAEKLGLEKIFISPFNKKALNKNQFKIEVVAVSKVDELYRLLF